MKGGVCQNLIKEVGVYQTSIPRCVLNYTSWLFRLFFLFEGKTITEYKVGSRKIVESTGTLSHGILGHKKK